MIAFIEFKPQLYGIWRKCRYNLYFENYFDHSANYLASVLPQLTTNSKCLLKIKLIKPAVKRVIYRNFLFISKQAINLGFELNMNSFYHQIFLEFNAYFSSTLEFCSHLIQRRLVTFCANNSMLLAIFYRQLNQFAKQHGRWIKKKMKNKYWFFRIIRISKKQTRQEQQQWQTFRFNLQQSANSLRTCNQVAAPCKHIHT